MDLKDRGTNRSWKKRSFEIFNVRQTLLNPGKYYEQVMQHARETSQKTLKSAKNLLDGLGVDVANIKTDHKSKVRLH